MSVEEKIQLCSRCLFTWIREELNGIDTKKQHEEIADMFTAQVLRKKLKAFKVDIYLPDALILILDVATESNPGLVQIILKDLLNSIVKRKGLIKPGYVITSTDFSHCFPFEFPIMEIPKINEKYSQLWNEQKKPTTGVFDGDNKCDTPEWWLEVMEM